MKQKIKTTNNGGDRAGVAPVGVPCRTFHKVKWPSPAFIVGGFSNKNQYSKLLLLLKFSLILMISLVMVISVYSTFNVDSSISITGLQYSSQAWGDYNNDGNPDLAICGVDSSNIITTKLYILNNSQLTQDTTQNIANVTECSLNFGDLNRDGFLDLIISGRNGTGNDLTNNVTTIIYTNNGTRLNEQQRLQGVKFSSTILGDIDNDGWLDLALTGCSNGTSSVASCSKRNASIYRNSLGTLVYNETWSQNLTAVWKSSIAFGDYDNDGDLDLALAGTTGQTTTASQDAGAITKVYINNGTTFKEDTTNIIEGTYWGSLAWEDFNNDTALDLFIRGK